MKSINIIFPNQLFEDSVLLKNSNDIYLIEEYLFFKQYAFHKQKIAFHRASMKAYEKHLLSMGKNVFYVESSNPISDIRFFNLEVNKKRIKHIHCIDPCDDWLEQHVVKHNEICKIHFYENPLFLNTRSELSNFFRKDKKSFFQTTFYKQQRKKYNILLDENHNPLGGKWTYDFENRKKYPKGKTPPPIEFPQNSLEWEEACKYTQKYFCNNPGSLHKEPIYPITFQETRGWLNQFLKHRFYDFGIYEDAILKEHVFLNHSLLSPLMNIGLISPKEIIDKTIFFAEKENIPINSTEGFVRQIIGWREFIRGMYLCKGRFSRTKNYWSFKRKIPASFYDGTTGITPIDDTIKKILKTAYCHHIERLMLLGNFMLLCEFHPDEVYRWFMELFIDAYDWVMVPNVYGMSLFADGGSFATKPYIGGANYVRKMSNYPKGDWEGTWNGLFWRFVYAHKDVFESNPRTSMLVHSLKRMSREKLQSHLLSANSFLKKIDN